MRYHMTIVRHEARKPSSNYSTYKNVAFAIPPVVAMQLTSLTLLIAGHRHKRYCHDGSRGHQIQSHLYSSTPSHQIPVSVVATISHRCVVVCAALRSAQCECSLSVGLRLLHFERPQLAALVLEIHVFVFRGSAFSRNRVPTYLLERNFACVFVLLGGADDGHVLDMAAQILLRSRRVDTPFIVRLSQATEETAFVLEMAANDSSIYVQKCHEHMDFLRRSWRILPSRQSRSARN